MRPLKSNTVIVGKKETERKTGKKIQQNTEDMDIVEEKMVREKPFDEQKFIKREMKTIQEEKKELLRSVTELQHEVRQLKGRLAVKEEQVSRTVKRRRMRTVAHVETLALLSSTKADLKQSYQRCAALEQKLVGETEDSQQMECGDHFRVRQPGQDVETLNNEFCKKEEALQLQMLEKEQQMQEQMRQKLFTIQEDFQKKLSEEREKNRQEQSEREERLRQQLEEKDDSFKKQLSVACEHWESRVQHWSKHQSELQDKLQEQENLRKQQEEESKQETEHLREEIQQLQVSAFASFCCPSMSGMRKLKLDFSFQQFFNAERKEKNKSSWRWILKLWKK